MANATTNTPSTNVTSHPEENGINASSSNKPSMCTTSPEAQYSIDTYTARASSYDSAGWHEVLGRDYITWSKPPRGGAVLDLACGTGLVTLPAAEAVGPEGVVVGIDLTRAMLEEGRRKPVNAQTMGKIVWIEYDISQDLLRLPEVSQVVNERGGFDLVCCCSALVLLPNPQDAVRPWAQLLKNGGKMIIDVPTQDEGLLNIMGSLLRDVAEESTVVRLRDWVQDVHSLNRVFEDAGLRVERSWKESNPIIETWYNEDEWERVCSKQLKKFPAFKEKGKIEEAKELFRKRWMNHLTSVRDDDGNERLKFWDQNALYVTIGVRD